MNKILCLARQGNDEIIGAELGRFIDTISNWELLKQGNHVVHRTGTVGPNTKSRTAMLQAVRGLFNHWTLGRFSGEVVTEANRALCGWRATPISGTEKR